MTYEDSLQFFRDRGYLLFDELSPEAQVEAKENVLIPEYAARARNNAKAKAKFKDNMHRAINDPAHIRRLYNGTAALRNIKKRGESYLLAFIRQNVTWYTPDGRYVNVYTGETYGRSKQLSEEVLGQ